MEALKRLRLFKKLDPNFEIDKIVRLVEPIRYDDLTIREGVYAVGTPRLSHYTGYMVVVLVDLENTMSGHYKDIDYKAYREGFSCWRIRLKDFENFVEFKPLRISHNFIYKGGDKVD